MHIEIMGLRLSSCKTIMSESRTLSKLVVLLIQTLFNKIY